MIGPSYAEAVHFSCPDGIAAAVKPVKLFFFIFSLPANVR